jgi:hypothetical protein
MLQLTYYSRSTGGADERSSLATLRSILESSARNNGRDDITGYLVFDGTWFMQVLEGDPGKVRAAYNRIQEDRRHTDLVLTSTMEVRVRSFPDWAMGGTRRSSDTEAIFIRHGLDRDFDPRRLAPMFIPALALDLSRMARFKKAAARAAPPRAASA